MKIDVDKVPINLEEALTMLKKDLTDEDIKELTSKKFHPARLHFSLGMVLRNSWSLWEKDTILVQWFKREYGIEHADDISGLILHCLWKDLNKEPRKEKELAQSYINHWKNTK